jgi:hypothetical protein
LNLSLDSRKEGNAPEAPLSRLAAHLHLAKGYPVLTICRHYMDALARREHHRSVRVLPHIKKLDDALGDFIVRVTCPCGASRQIEPEALARITGRSMTFAALATRMRCSQCGR